MDCIRHRFAMANLQGLGVQGAMVRVGWPLLCKAQHCRVLGIVARWLTYGGRELTDKKNAAAGKPTMALQEE